MNQPVSAEGREVWALAMKLGGQIRIASGFEARAIGWDMAAAFALGDALGFDRLAIAELLPEIEAVAMRKINEQLTEGSPDA